MHLKHPTYALLVIVFVITAWPTLPFLPEPDLTPPLWARDTMTAAAWGVTLILCCIFLFDRHAKATYSLLIMALGCVPLLTIAVWNLTVRPGLGMWAEYLILAGNIEGYALRLPFFAAFFLAIRLISLLTAPSPKSVPN